MEPFGLLPGVQAGWVTARLEMRCAKCCNRSGTLRKVTVMALLCSRSAGPATLAA